MEIPGTLKNAFVVGIAAAAAGVVFSQTSPPQNTAPAPKGAVTPAKKAPPKSAAPAPAALTNQDVIKMVKAKLPDELIIRSEEHTSELQSRFGISYAVFC